MDLRWSHTHVLGAASKEKSGVAKRLVVFAWFYRRSVTA